MSSPITLNKSQRNLKSPPKSKPSLSRKTSDIGSNGVSAATMKTWSRGNHDMVPSTKMLEMVRLLQEWDATGDKTIIYSQCE